MGNASTHPAASRPRSTRIGREPTALKSGLAVLNPRPPEGAPRKPNLTTQLLCAIRTHVVLRSTPTPAAMIRCHLARLMHRNKLRVSDVARETGLNRSTVSALCKETATRVELPAVERLCRLLGCEIGDLFEYLPDEAGNPK